MTFALLYFLVGIALTLAGYAVGKRVSKAERNRMYGKFGAPIVVEEYRIERATEAGGFQKLCVYFQDAQGRTFPFEFHPAYAHHLSDELLTQAAKAMGPDAKPKPPQASKA